MSEPPCILVTRPEPDAKNTADHLERLGYRTARLPLLNIRLLKKYKEIISHVDKEVIQIIALTSSHALSGLESLRELPIAVVGSASAGKARTMGFKRIHTAEGNAPALAELIAETFSPAKGAVFYPHGRHISFDLTNALQLRGFSVKDTVAYDAEPLQQLPETFTHLIEKGEIHAVSVYSLRTLETLEHLIRHHRLEDFTKHIFLVCMSANIAKEATHGLWQKTVHADAPEEASMLESFKRLYGEPPRITTGA